MKSTPSSQVKDRFGDKAKLVAAVQKLTTDALWFDKLNPEKGLDSVSNSKLLRLHGVLTLVQKEFGSRDKLATAILELDKRQKDKDYKTKLLTLSTPRLVDMHRSAARRAKVAAAKPAAKAKAKKQPRSKKAQAKAKAN
jgi:hypothetical protein